MTVLIAGGAGFIGSHLCKKLLNDNYKVICIDNFLTSDAKNISSLSKNSNFKFIKYDVTQPLDSIRHEVSSIKYIFHLASPASPNKKSPAMLANDGRVVSSFINQAIRNKPITVYGKGTQTRSFCYVDDMVAGIKLAMFSDNTKGQVFNLGNPDERTVLDIAKLIKKITKSKSEIVFENLPEDDPRERNPDISKAKRILGWTPKVPTEKGLKKTIEYFESL